MPLQINQIPTIKRIPTILNKGSLFIRWYLKSSLSPFIYPYHKINPYILKGGLDESSPYKRIKPLQYYSTVTLFARFLGWSTSAPLIAPM